MMLHLFNLGGGLQFIDLRNPKNPPSLNGLPIFFSSSVRCASQLAGDALPLHDVAAILHNKVLVSAAVSGAIGQLSKPFSSTILYGKKFDLKTCLQSGGFPSTHSSSVVATATCLAMERGFSDSLFGLAVVYASLVMYDAQGVRREVGTHARVLNKVMPSTTLYSPSSTNDANDLVNSYCRESSSSSSDLVEITDPVFLEERGSLQKKPTSSVLLDRMHIRSSSGSGIVSDSGGGSESEASSLKESIGHTEIEVAAGALLGLLVSLVICPYL